MEVMNTVIGCMKIAIDLVSQLLIRVRGIPLLKEQFLSLGDDINEYPKIENKELADIHFRDRQPLINVFNTNPSHYCLTLNISRSSPSKFPPPTEIFPTLSQIFSKYSSSLSL